MIQVCLEEHNKRSGGNPEEKWAPSIYSLRAVPPSIYSLQAVPASCTPEQILK